MQYHRLMVSLGAGVTTFFLVSVSIIELLDIEFSAIIALPIGLLAGVAVLVVLWRQFTALSQSSIRASSAYAAFGLTVLVLLALRYVNLGREVLSVDVMVGIGIATAVVVYIGLWHLDG